MIFVIIFSFLIILSLTVLYCLYRFVFCHPVKKRPEKHTVPDTVLYREHKDKMLACVKETEETPHEDVSIVSEDGYRLAGKLYMFKNGAPVVIFFHGYHGIAEWDGYGFFKICREHEINILMVDERAHGKSGSKVITFGIMERHDCIQWIGYVNERFGTDTEIILSGVSMGAATVLMASELGFPANVSAVIADCGYTEPVAMVKETIRNMKLPVKPVYFLIRLAARIYGGFNLEEASALSAVSKIMVPVLFIHGSGDSVVPVSMNEALYKNCNAVKQRVLIAGADHANSALTDYDTYRKEIVDFLNKSLTHHI